MRKVSTLILALLALGALPHAPAGAHDSFEQRRDTVLSVMRAQGERSFNAVCARLALSPEDNGAIALFDSLLSDERIAGMFFSYTSMGTYLHFRDRFPATVSTALRETFKHRTLYRGDTENHWVCYYTGLYLAAQTWPGLPGSEWFNGKSSTENFTEARGWLTFWMKTTTTIGQGEFDSPTYMNVFLAPMCVLYDCATDSIMKQRAGMMIDWLLADAAAEQLQGNYCGGHSRDYPDDIINPLAAPATMWAYLYFGQPASPPWEDAQYRPRIRGSWEVVFGALSNYRLPASILGIATDRSAPYVHTETKRVRNVIRFGEVRNPPVYKYTYMTADYALGSLQGGILQPIQQHTWDITYVSDRPNNTIFTLHPYYAGKELAMFFPEEQKFLAAEVDRYHKVYTDPDKWNSSSPYEQTFQHRNSLIVLYDIDSTARQQHVDGFFPKTLDTRTTDSTGWIFCRAGKTFVAVYPLKPYAWIDEERDWRFRSSALKNGVVVQAGDEEEFGSFDNFTQSVTRTVIATQESPGRWTVRYTTPAHDDMTFTYNGPRVLNGVPQRFATYKLFNGPFMHSEIGSGDLLLHHGQDTTSLHFPWNE